MSLVAGRVGARGANVPRLATAVLKNDRESARAVTAVKATIVKAIR